MSWCFNLSVPGIFRKLRRKIRACRSQLNKQTLQLVPNLIKETTPMSDYHSDDGSKKVKNIAAVLYLLVLTFLVGGSYLNQQAADNTSAAAANAANP